MDTRRTLEIGPFGSTNACGCCLKNCGAGERARTADLLITNQLLYQLSYAGTGKT
jgi:hypothetical protein